MIPGTLFTMHAMWPWLWRYDHGSRSWHALGLWTSVVWHCIDLIQVTSEKVVVCTWIWVIQTYMCPYKALDIWPFVKLMSLLGHEQKLGKESFKSNSSEKWWSTHTFGYVYTVTLNLKNNLESRSDTLYWVMDRYCMEFQASSEIELQSRSQFLASRVANVIALVSASAFVSASVCVREQKLNLGHNFLTRSDRAFILHMCIPCDKTFTWYHNIWLRDLDPEVWPSFGKL